LMAGSLTQSPHHQTGNADNVPDAPPS
jgi:hypothetical protein